jgi:hypothetical protein
MAETLVFQKLYQYDLRPSGISVPVRLLYGDKQAEFNARVDTGASSCIFARIYGEVLGLGIETGTPQKVSTVMGSFMTFGHQLTLSVLEISFETTVYFAADPTFTRNVLGRQGWLDRIRLGLVDYEGKLYLSDYNDAT